MTDLYEILGVTTNATKAEIKAAYRRLAQQLHPDKNNSDEAAKRRFLDVQRAYEILSDDTKREVYDQTGISDPKLLDIDSMAINSLAGAYIKIIEGLAKAGRNPLELCIRDELKELIGRDIASFKKSEADNERLIKFFDATAARIDRKCPDTPDIFTQAANAKKNELENKNLHLRLNIRIGNTMLNYLENFSEAKMRELTTRTNTVTHGVDAFTWSFL